MEACLAQPCRFAAGLQKNAQALQRMLKCPLLYRSSKPRLDAFQKHYVPKERRVRGPPHLLRVRVAPRDPPVQLRLSPRPSEGCALPVPPSALLLVAASAGGREARRG